MAVVSLTVHLIIVIAIAFQLYRKLTILRGVFWPALLLKLCCGICLGLLYTYYYPPSDTFSYYSDASRLVSLARTDPGSYLEVLIHNNGLASLDLTNTEPRALFLTKITSIVNFFTLDNYWATGLYFSFAAFIASLYLVKVITDNISSARGAAIVAFMFLPSAVFWTSGLLKESLAIAGLFYLSGLFLKVWFRMPVRRGEWLLAILGFSILWNLKYYYAGIFIAVTGTSIVYRYLIHKRFVLQPGAELVAWLAVLILPMLIVTFLHPNFNIDRVMSVITLNHWAYVKVSDPGNFIEFKDLNPSLGSMVRNSPWALFSGLFRPLLWESSTMMQFVYSFENTILLLFFTGALLRVKSYRKSPHRLLILTAMVYVILLGIFIALSAPNFGTLSRYRAGYIGFFTLLILCNNPLFQYAERSLARLVPK